MSQSEMNKNEVCHPVTLRLFAFTSTRAVTVNSATNSSILCFLVASGNWLTCTPQAEKVPELAQTVKTLLLVHNTSSHLVSLNTEQFAN